MFAVVLVEAWQVEVVGSRVARVAVGGAVRWAAPEAKALGGSTPFKLQVRALSFHGALFCQTRVHGVEWVQRLCVECCSGVMYCFAVALNVLCPASGNLHLTCCALHSALSLNPVVMRSVCHVVCMHLKPAPICGLSPEMRVV
jgi:hypothetical protein